MWRNLLTSTRRVGASLARARNVRAVCLSQLRYQSNLHEQILWENPHEQPARDSGRLYKPFNYHNFAHVADNKREKSLSDPNRFQSLSQREDRSDVPAEAVKAHHNGKYITVHRGCSMMKCPEDLIIYSQLFWYLQPATIFEIGTYSGGTALWMADMLKTMGVDSEVYSIDIDLSLVTNHVKELQPPNVKFIEGDSYKIEESFPAEFLLSKPHPWVVIEDAHENFHGVLTHFHDHMQKGDYFIIDDTNPDIPSRDTMAGLKKGQYEKKGPAKLNALKKFFTEYEEYYAVDSFFTDFFGYNGTWDWHGYIRRMK